MLGQLDFVVVVVVVVIVVIRWIGSQPVLQMVIGYFVVSLKKYRN